MVLVLNNTGQFSVRIHRTLWWLFWGKQMDPAFLFKTRGPLFVCLPLSPIRCSNLISPANPMRGYLSAKPRSRRGMRGTRSRPHRPKKAAHFVYTRVERHAGSAAASSTTNLPASHTALGIACQYLKAAFKAHRGEAGLVLCGGWYCGRIAAQKRHQDMRRVQCARVLRSPIKKPLCTAGSRCMEGLNIAVGSADVALRALGFLLWLDWATIRFRVFGHAARCTWSFCVFGPVLSSPAHVSISLAMRQIEIEIVFVL
jgi:hypothetical protein